jgi:hypothetical protein
MIPQDVERRRWCDDDDVGLMPGDGFGQSFCRFDGEAIFPQLMDIDLLVAASGAAYPGEADAGPVGQLFLIRRVVDLAMGDD